jgi:hypothetical protein
MAWVDLPLGNKELSINTNGTIEWNAALQLAMGDPAWVDVMWDAIERTLGIRAVNAPLGVPVYKEPKSGEYSIDSADILTAAGITVAETLNGEPDSWVETDAGGGWAEWFGFNPIYYLTVPE